MVMVPTAPSDGVRWSLWRTPWRIRLVISAWSRRRTERLVIAGCSRARKWLHRFTERRGIDDLVGDDWAEYHRDVHVMDEAERRLTSRRLPRCPHRRLRGTRWPRPVVRCCRRR